MPHLRRWRRLASYLSLLLLLQVALPAISVDPLLLPPDSNSEPIGRAGLFCDTSADALSSVPAPRTCIWPEDAGDGGGSAIVKRRCWYTYTPRSPPVDDAPADAEGVPLVLDLHGVLSCAKRSAGYTGWKDLAARDSFVLVWPQGIEDSDLALPVPCWNAGGCCCFEGSRVLGNDEERVVDVPDVPFLAQVISDTVASSAVPIDTGRIYLAGHSNGCMMAQRLAVEMSGIIAAVCCHSGVAAFDLDDAVLSNGETFVPTPVMTIHGDIDATVPYSGGGVIGSFLGSPSAESNAAAWAKANGCDPTPSVEEDFTGTFATHTFGRCEGGASVRLVQVYGVGHFPYRDRSELWGDNFGQTDVDTTRMAMEFCFEHRKDEAGVALRLPPCTGCTQAPTGAPTTRGPTAPSIAAAAPDDGDPIVAGEDVDPISGGDGPSKLKGGSTSSVTSVRPFSTWCIASAVCIIAVVALR